MNICVLVKQVPDHEAIVRAAPDGSVEVEDRWVTNFFDEIAIEQALRIRDAHDGTLTAVAAGGARQVDALRRALAMGANAALHVSDPALDSGDALVVARALAAAIETLSPDLVLAGRVALDDEMGYVGPAVAHALAIPHVANVVALDVGDSALKADRLVEGGVETVEGPLPALVTATKGLCEPRVPKVMAVMKASRAKIDARDLASFGIEPPSPTMRIDGHEAPPSRPAVEMIQGTPDEQVRRLARILLDAVGGGS